MSNNVKVTNAVSTSTDPNVQGKILTPEALTFLEALHKHFNDRRLGLLEMRQHRQEFLDNGGLPDFLPETKHVREGDWTIAPEPTNLEKRIVEITGPADAKMMINALNAPVDSFMVDLEDAMSPTWDNVVQGQANIYDAIRDCLRFEDKAKNKTYALNDKTATLLVRPRGWHLPEKHLLVDDEPMSGSLVDFGLTFFHNAQESLDRGKGPYFYLPKLESHLEARLWNDVFVFSQDYLKIPQGSIKATVLIETILAAFEMDEILFELRDHSAGLNAGRWDYIFSVIKKFKKHPDKTLPDRAQVTMASPFMHAYTELLVKTCHKRDAHAMGGMAAFIPSRRDEAVNRQALTKVAEDKKREAKAGFDGTWIAHPDLADVARAQFESVAPGLPHQKDRLRLDVNITQKDLLNFRIEGGTVTKDGVSTNIRVALQYVDHWLKGQGAVALYNLMEDAATAEISRAQLWQWLHSNGRGTHDFAVTPESYKELRTEEVSKLHAKEGGDYSQAAALLDDLILKDSFPEFLTLPAYSQLA